MLKMQKEIQQEIGWGEFCDIFGATPRNRVIEFLLETRELDYSVGDIARETRLNRATAYNIIEQLAKQDYVVPTRKLSGAQLYKLDTQKKEVKFLIEIFNKVLDLTVAKYKKKKSLTRA